MNQDMSIISLVLHASFVVQVVMAGLMIVSLISWTVIFGKLIGLKQVRVKNDEFEREFWAGRHLGELYQAANNKPASGKTAPMERIFASGMREFFKLREKKLDAGVQLDGARRAMRASGASALFGYNFAFTAKVAELVDAPDLGSGAERHGGSSPFFRTKFD